MNISGMAIFVIVLMLAIVGSIVLAIAAGLLLHTSFFFIRMYLILLKRKLLRGVSSQVADAPSCTACRASGKRNKVHYRKKLIYAFFDPLLKCKGVRNQSTAIHETKKD